MVELRRFFNHHRKNSEENNKLKNNHSLLPNSLSDGVSAFKSKLININAHIDEMINDKTKNKFKFYENGDNNDYYDMKGKVFDFYDDSWITNGQNSTEIDNNSKKSMCSSEKSQIEENYDYLNNLFEKRELKDDHLYTTGYYHDGVLDGIVQNDKSMQNIYTDKIVEEAPDLEKFYSTKSQTTLENDGIDYQSYFNHSGINDYNYYETKNEEADFDKLPADELEYDENQEGTNHEYEEEKEANNGDWVDEFLDDEQYTNVSGDEVAKEYEEGAEFDEELDVNLYPQNDGVATYENTDDNQELIEDYDANYDYQYYDDAEGYEGAELDEVGEESLENHQVDGAISQDQQDDFSYDDSQQNDYPALDHRDKLHLMPYTLEEISEVVEIRHTEEKGRCMYAKNDFDPGSIIFVELPVLVATPSLDTELWEKIKQIDEEERLSLPPIWHLASLYSMLYLEPSKRNICLDKWTPQEIDECEVPPPDVIRVLQKLHLPLVYSKLYGKLLYVWRYNSFGHHSESDGLVLYNQVSLISHSCAATACWHYGADDSFILRSRVKLAKGGEISISYISDDDLFRSLNVRREQLSGWLFTCQCRRCAAKIDNTRGFRCDLCLSGTIFFRTDTDGVTISQSCTVCGSTMSDETLQNYLIYEKSYISRLNETDENDIVDAEHVYEMAKNLFTQHWVLFQLHGILFEAYKRTGVFHSAMLHQLQRIQYCTQVMPQCSYVLAWLHEEMGDVLCNLIDPSIFDEDCETTLAIREADKMQLSRFYTDAMALLLVLCGEDHEYFRSTQRKHSRILSLQTESLLNQATE